MFFEQVKFLGEGGKGGVAIPTFSLNFLKHDLPFICPQWDDVLLLNEVFGTPTKIGDCLAGSKTPISVWLPYINILTKSLLPPRQGCTNLSCSSSSALRCPLRWTLGEIRERVKNYFADFFRQGGILGLNDLDELGDAPAPLPSQKVCYFDPVKISPTRVQAKKNA